MANLFFFLLPFCLYAQEPQQNSHAYSATSPSFTKTFFRLGDQLITVEKSGPDNHSILIIGLHNNEQTAILNASFFAEGYGTRFIQLQHKGGQYIEANLRDKNIRFDPDKIFTPAGRKINLKETKSWSKFSIQQVGLFARFMENQFANTTTIISVHETDNEENIYDYTHTPSLIRMSKAIHISETSNPDDFIITTDENLFKKLKPSFNVVLLNKHKIKDDGSLKLYCIRGNKTFVQIQTSAEHTAEQNEMLRSVCSIMH